jgi:hypothetical protein
LSFSSLFLGMAYVAVRGKMENERKGKEKGRRAIYLSRQLL